MLFFFLLVFSPPDGGRATGLGQEAFYRCKRASGGRRRRSVGFFPPHPKPTSGEPGDVYGKRKQTSPPPPPPLLLFYFFFLFSHADVSS